MAYPSERRGSEKSKNVSKFLVGQKLRELDHFEISKFSKNFLVVGHFSRFFRKCRKFENCFSYNSKLKLKISRDAERTAKVLTKRPFRPIWVLVILPF